MRKLLLILVIGPVLFTGYAAAQVGNDRFGDVTVTVEGAVRTKKVFIESLVKDCLKRGEYEDWPSVDAKAMGQCISNSRLFSSVAVVISAPVITVKVTERWTLIPIPNIYASEGRSSYGVFVYESNFLGYGKIAGIGGALSTEGNTFSLMYMDRAVGFTDYTLRIFALRSSGDKEAFDNETVVYGYRKVDESFTVSPGYRFTPNLEASLLLSYSDKEYSRLDLFTPVPGDYRSWDLGAGLRYRRADYKLFYNDGFSARINWYIQAARSDDQKGISNVTANFAWDKLLFDRHVLQLGLQGTYQTDAAEADVSMFGRGRGYRGIEPDGLWTNRIVAVSADYQIPVSSRKRGVVTVAPFMDYGVYKSFFDGGSDDYLAYGVGVYYFVNFINFPGLGLNFGVNDDFMGRYVSIQIGKGFH